MEFKCEEAQRLAQERGISERTIRRYLRSLLENGTLEQPSHGQYRFSTKYK
jgi:DeoR/GlpR family transcriptional regulator of sugar metabolism